ncbi:MAG: IclR family transcriptional regulator C-terminal domain-containing protein [Anaerolineae bacterium]
MSISDDVYLKTVDRALKVLLRFDEEHPEWGSSELADALGLHRSVVYRSLATLENRGFVARVDGSARFRLGLKLVELGNIVLSGIDLRRIAHPEMVRLAKETGASAFLTVVSDDESVCIDRVDSPQRVRVTLNVGRRYPLHAGASNKLLLAYLPPEARAEVIARGLPAYTPNTITGPEALEEDLAIIRRQGWAFTVGELTPEVAAIGVPVRDSNGEVVAALSIAGLASRFSEDRLPQLLDVTRDAGERISGQLLAWQAPQPATWQQGSNGTARIGLIRVLSTDDKELLNSHGRLLEGFIGDPGLVVISRCIEGHPKGLWNDEEVHKAIPRIVRLGQEMEHQDQVGALLVSCAADPGVTQLSRAVAIPALGAGSASASVARALGRPVGALGITEAILPAIAEVLGDQLVGWEKPESVKTTVDLMSEAGKERFVEAGEQLMSHGAEVILLACTGFSTARIAPFLEETLGIPVIDPVVSAGLATYYIAVGNRRRVVA